MKNNFMSFMKIKRNMFDRLITHELTKFWRLNNLSKQTEIKNINTVSKHLDLSFRCPNNYFVNSTSKKLRPILGYLLLKSFRTQQTNRFIKYLILPEILHSASLIADDIEDNANIRRDKPCLHAKYGIDTAINIANALYFFPFYFIKESKIPLLYKIRIYEALTKSMNRMHLGQGLDILWHKTQSVNVSPQEYLIMARLKTSSFFIAEAEIAAIFSNVNHNQRKEAVIFSENIGAAFQIMDDVLDLTLDKNENAAFGKKFAQDITEGKKTLILLFALQNATIQERKKINKILAQHTNNQAAINDIICLFKKYDSIQKSAFFAKNLANSAWNRFEKYLKPSKAKDFLYYFCNFVTERRY